MATYKKKLIDSKGNVILPYTRAECVYLSDNQTLSNWITNFATTASSVAVSSLTVSNFNALDYNGLRAWRIYFPTTATASPGIYNYGFLIQAQLNSTNKLQAYFPHNNNAAKFRVLYDNRWIDWQSI